MAADTLITLAEEPNLHAPPSGAASLWTAFSENRGAVAGAAVALLIVLAAVFAALVAPYSPFEQFRDAIKAPPAWAGGTWRFPLGTDGAGRDVLSRLIYGARVSLFIGFAVMAVTPVWGSMLADARQFIRSDPWIVTLPGLAILVTVVSINLAGDGLRDALDPKMRRS